MTDTLNFTPTYMRWYNSAKGAKVMCHQGKVEKLPYGSTSTREFHANDRPPHPQFGQFQWGLACSPESRTIVDDGDYPGEWGKTAAGKLLGDWRDVATSVRDCGDGTVKFHVAEIVPLELIHLWPKRKPVAYGHIISNGLCYVEGMHASGTEYLATGKNWVVATEALMLAHLEDNGGCLHTDHGTASADDLDDDADGWEDPDAGYSSVMAEDVLGNWVVEHRNESLVARCGIIKGAGDNGTKGMRTLFSDLCAEYDIETGRGDSDVYRAYARCFPAWDKARSAAADAPLPPGWQQALDKRTAKIAANGHVPQQEDSVEDNTTGERTPRFTAPPLLFLPGEGFHPLDACRWVQQQGALCYGRDDQIWAHLGGVWVPGEDEFHQRVAWLLANKYQRAHEMNVRELLRAAVPKIGCEPVPDVINFRNGLLYWRETDEIRPHDPKVLSTVQLAADWKPAAACPLFQKYLGEVLTPQDVVRAWELAGYLVRSGNPLHRLFLLYGTGRNGKGAFLRIMTALLGEDNVSAVALHELAADKFMPAELFGRTANLAGDIDATYIERTGQLKAMSGGDAIPAQRKFGHPFRFTPWAVSVFSANRIPTSSDSSEGWRARWEVLSFPNWFSGKGGEAMEAGLRAELDGIAACAVRALRRLEAAGTFTATDTSLAAKAEFEKGQDPLAYWLEERTVPGDWTSRPMAFTSYAAWAEASKMKPLSKRNFYDLMRQRFAETPRNGYPGYAGLKLSYGG